ncbi:MAG: hypothetical protein K0U72_05630 [Gammaproteobacteria bacterium]|nr:hypothetical protein [Gammaproteobacteria bacterium]
MHANVDFYALRQELDQIDQQIITAQQKPYLTRDEAVVLSGWIMRRRILERELRGSSIFKRGLEA